MRLLTPRRVAVTALCAALTLGTAGPALAHSTHQAAEQRATSPQDISDILGSIGGVLDSVFGTVSGTNSTQTLPATEMNQQMKDLTAAIEALREAAAESKTGSTSGTTGTTGTTGTGAAADDMPTDLLDPVNSVDGLDALDAMGSVDTADADMDKALAAMDKAIDDLVAAAVEGQAVTSASQVQAATKTLMDTIMRDVAKMTGTPAAGMNTLPATTLPATSPQTPVTADR
ncbi:hypothetical protein [Streptomyces sp. NPDC000229]|uniref:hypothetical protein n=1 Tax=Streptomyces sp. NPDC000229 TaxID=3154247 RepID=UPI003333075A